MAFVSEGGLTKLLTAGTHYWVPPTLNDLEERLDPRQFYRISRRAIVNLDAVREVVPQDDGTGRIAAEEGGTAGGLAPPLSGFANGFESLSG